MAIKYQKVDKKFILDALNPRKYRKGKPSYAPSKFSYFRIGDSYIHFGITHKIGDCDRPDLAGLGGSSIKKLEEKYKFCSVSSHNRKSGLDVILRRDRWNECHKCKKVLWYDSSDGMTKRNSYKVVTDNHKVKALCMKCFRKKWKIVKGIVVKK